MQYGVYEMAQYNFFCGDKSSNSMVKADTLRTGMQFLIKGNVSRRQKGRKFSGHVWNQAFEKYVRL